MSDLQCAATLLLARHGEAEYETALLSDAGGTLTARGREQSRALGRSLRSAHLAAIYSSDLSRAVQTAEIVAAETGVPVTVREGLREWSVGEYAGRAYETGLFEPVFAAWAAGRHDVGVPGAETGAEIRARVRSTLEAIADLHRGETVLVVSHTGAIQTGVPPLVGLGDAAAAGLHLASCAVVEVAVDGDGWVLRTWADEDPLVR